MSRTSAGVARRRALIAALLGSVLGCVLLATVVLGDLGGGPGTPPAGAASAVPADALAYVHVSIDRGRPEVRRALALLARLPVAPAQLLPLTARLGLAAPWLGREAAYAILPEGSLTVLDVRDRTAARRALAALGTPSAFVGRYAVVGSRAAVDAALGAAARGTTLLRADVFRRASAGAPGDRVADAYISAAGIPRLLLRRPGAPAMLGTLLSRPALAGAALSVSPADGGFRARIHVVSDTALSGLGPGGGGTFTPTLSHVVPAGAALMVDERRLDQVGKRLLAAAGAGGVGGSVRPLLSQLGSALAAENVDVPAVLHLFAGETAVALVSPASGAAGNESLLLVSRVGDGAAARTTLASLATPLMQLFAGTAVSAGQTPVLDNVAVGSDSIQELVLGPGLRVDYSVAHGLVIVSTSRAAVAAVLRRAGDLNGDPRYRQVLPTSSSGVTSLVFLDFNQLLNLVGQTGLTRGAQFAALRPDLQRIRAVGIRATSGEADSTAELFLQIS